jgi:threonine synthase
MNINFYSTNKKAPKVNFKTALLTGIAPDRGLYMPESIPTLSKETINSFREMEYHEIAYHVTKEFIGDLIPEGDLRAITKDAYNFEVPLEHVKDNTYVLRLDQGPTASFKDFAARMMARLVEHFLKEEKRKILILVATSGDTGSAIANAFYSLKNINVLVLFPEKEVSTRQRKQMTTLGKNIEIVSVDGKFDDCQNMVKTAFADSELSDLNLNSANSINFGRILPQAIYYFWAHSRLSKANEKITFSIPSGNFGNMMGAVVAKNMGLPIEKLVIATNENREFPLFLDSANYEKIEPSIDCISNAMNVGHPSNLSRLVDIFDGELDQTGELHKTPDMERMRNFIFSTSVDDQTTMDTIVEAYKNHNLLLEPHGAVGWKGLERYLETAQDKKSIFVSVETAHPAKFPDQIKELINLDPKLPKSLQDLDSKSENYSKANTNYQNFKTHLLTNYKES